MVTLNSGLLFLAGASALLAAGLTSTPAWAVWLSLAAAAGVLSVGLHNRALERRVEERTRELLASQRRVQVLLANQMQLSGVLSPSGAVLLANPAALRLAGIREEDVLGVPFWETVWWSHDPALQAQLEDAIERAAHGELVRFEATHPTPEGELRLIDFSIKPSYDAAGELEFLIPEGRDMTERRLLETRLRSAQKHEAVSNLAGGIAHDFNNILSTMLGFAELAQLDAQERGDKAASKQLDYIIRGALRARDLIRKILTFSRKQPIQRGVTALRDVLRESHGLLRPSLPASIEIEVDAPVAGPVIGDAMELERIVVNLCTNSLQAMPQGGRLTLRLREVELSQAELEQQAGIEQQADHRPGRYVVLSVQDTGAGMSPEVAEQAFDPYFTTKDVLTGTGLGLSVVKGVVRDLEGWIALTTSPGQGTRFDLTFPYASAAPDPRPSAPPPGEVTPQRVLVVDDEPALATVLSTALRRWGHEVTLLNDPAEALEVFQADPAAFDALCTDLTMPGMNGLELIRACRALRGDLRVLLWSGYVGDSVLTELEDIELIFMPKPMTPQQVVKALDEMAPASSPRAASSGAAEVARSL